MPPDLSPQYNAAEIERAIYDRWLAAGVFTAHADHSKRAGGTRDPFVIVIPPPNVTAVLHMGHGLNNTVQDVIVRWRRMAGDETLWVPGTDHAGIATQNVIEKQLAAEGKMKEDVGRDAFVKRTETFVAETGRVILKQLEAIGASCDWTRTAYTLSPELSRAVREAFVRLYEDGLIYKGHRVIHWCPRCLTSLSDEEAEPVETDGRLYHIAYPVAGDPSRERYGRHDAPRDDVRRRGGGGESGRRALRVARRQDGHSADREHRDPGDRRRVRRSRVRHGRREDHARARRERFRSGPPPQARDADRDRRDRRDERRRRRRGTRARRAQRRRPLPRARRDRWRCSRRAGAS